MRFEMPDFLGNWQARRDGKKLGTGAFGTSARIKEIVEKFPDLKEPKKPDPALQEVLKNKLAEGRITQKEFDAELRKYEEPNT